jgi:hypothetical protein
MPLIYILYASKTGQDVAFFTVGLFVCCTTPVMHLCVVVKLVGTFE